MFFRLFEARASFCGKIQFFQTQKRAAFAGLKQNRKHMGIFYRDFLVSIEIAHCLRLRSIVRYTYFIKDYKDKPEFIVIFDKLILIGLLSLLHIWREYAQLCHHLLLIMILIYLNNGVQNSVYAYLIPETFRVLPF